MRTAGEDEIDYLLRLIREKKAEYAESLATGTSSAENVQNGYRDISGQIKGLAKAEELVLQVFRGEGLDLGSPSRSAPIRTANRYD